MKQGAEEDSKKNIPAFMLDALSRRKNVNAIHINTPVFKHLLYVFTNIKASVRTFYFHTEHSSVFVLKAFI